MLNFASYSDKIRYEIELYLEQCLSPCNCCPPLLMEAMRYSVLEGGKRVRASLAIHICRMFQGKDGNIFPAATAIEMIHGYSLVHDDLPAMDNDDYRRGKFSTHKKFGEAMGILTGDALLTHAFWLIAAKTEDRDLVAPIVEALGWAAGIGGMVSGQVADLLGERDIPNAELVAFIHTHKTAALIRSACQIGAIAAKATPELQQKIVVYGQNIGLAFQIVDDILDVTGKKERLGKTAGKDAAQGKITYPRVFGLEKAEEQAKKLIDDACQAVSNIPDSEYLVWLAQFIVSRDR